MAIKIYKKGSTEKLAPNFCAYEFDCACSRCTQTPVDEALPRILQQIRDRFGKPVRITGPYRCPAHNGEIPNAAKGSLHTKGMAADIQVDGTEPAEVAKFAESIGVLGIGLYDDFVHVDTRTYKSFWFGHGQEPRTTFGGTAAEPEHWYRIRKSWEDAKSQIAAYKNFENAKASCPDDYCVFDWNGKCVYERFGRYESEECPLEQFIQDVQAACGAAVSGAADPETLKKTVTIGANFNREHAVVKAVQARLYALGYEEVGEADGIAGAKFTAAMAHFQQDNGCTPTGMAEAWGQTWQLLLGLV